MRILAWYPFSETHVSKADLHLTDPFFARRRDLYWLNQDASRCFLGHPCLAEPEARQRLTDICRELSDYGVDGIFLSTRTHCPRPGLSSRLSPNPDDDEFGFNDPIVREVRSLTGVDISMVPIASLDPQVREAWYRVKGAALTQWLREVRAVLRPRGQDLFINIKPDRYSFLGNGVPANNAMRIYKDWETWIDEDLVDGVCAVTQRDFSPEPNVASIEPFTRTVPGGPFYVWTMNQYGRPPGQAASRVMDYGNWYARPPEVLDQVLAQVAREGARGAFMHEMYQLLFVDSGGRDIGIGAVPRDEYWPVIAKWAGATGS